MLLSELEIDIEGYSGPFDLLCSLVERGKIPVSGIKIAQLIRIYGLYLSKSGETPADTLAEFFWLTSGLLLEKTRSLLPGAKIIPYDEVTLPKEEVFIKSLERYRPYRKVYLWLSEKLLSSSKSFRHSIPEKEEKSTLHIDPNGNGAYILSRTWEALKVRQKSARKREHEISSLDWDGFSGKNDDEQIEVRMSEIEAMFEGKEVLSLHEIAGKSLVLTFLAVLELCRLGRAKIEQDELFSDVRIIPES